MPNIPSTGDIITITWAKAFVGAVSSAAVVTISVGAFMWQLRTDIAVLAIKLEALEQQTSTATTLTSRVRALEGAVETLNREDEENDRAVERIDERLRYLERGGTYPHKKGPK